MYSKFVTEVNNSVIEFEQIPDVLTIPELQKVLRVGRNTAYRLIQSKAIRSIRIGRSIRIPKKFVKEFVDGQNTPANNNETAMKEYVNNSDMDRTD